MSFKLIWNKEVIEENIKTREEAVYLRNEYSLAYNGNVIIKKERCLIERIINEVSL